jgi:hypothetical protein
MKTLIIALTFTLLSCLFIGTGTGGFVNEPTMWNDPNWSGLDNTTICPFCYSTPFSLDDYLNPQPKTEPTVEPEKPLPIVMPKPLPSTKGDIASLLDRLPTRQLPSQQFSKHVFFF